MGVTLPLYICLGLKNAFPTVFGHAAVSAMYTAGFTVHVVDFMADCFEKDIKQLDCETLPNNRGIAQGDDISSSLFSAAVNPVLRAGKAAAPSSCIIDVDGAKCLRSKLMLTTTSLLVVSYNC